jgi:hypothetical protein
VVPSRYSHTQDPLCYDSVTDLRQTCKHAQVCEVGDSPPMSYAFISDQNQFIAAKNAEIAKIRSTPKCAFGSALKNS